MSHIGVSMSLSALLIPNFSPLSFLVFLLWPLSRHLSRVSQGRSLTMSSCEKSAIDSTSAPRCSIALAKRLVPVHLVTFT